MNHSTSRNSALDLVRGLAAVAVCAGHLRAAIFVDYGQLQTTTIFQQIFYALTSLGHQAVIVFFILSGFFVGGSVLKKNKFKWNYYLISRLTRLWVVLIPTLFLTIIVDQIIQSNHPEVFVGSFSEIWASGPSVANEYSRSVTTFIGNVFFQQTIAVNVFGTNSPLWSLSNEFYYYILFPVLLLFLGYFDNSTIELRTILGIFGLTILILLPEGFVSGFLVFCLGGLVSWLTNGNKVALHSWRSRAKILIGGLIFLTSLVYSKISIAVPYLCHDVLTGVGFSIFLVALLNSKLPLAWLRKFAAFVADVSYSLYLIHFPIVLLIATTYYGEKQIQPDVLGLSKFVIALGVIFLAAVMFWLLFERHTEFIKHKILNLIASTSNMNEKDEN